MHRLAVEALEDGAHDWQALVTDYSFPDRRQVAVQQIREMHVLLDHALGQEMDANPLAV